MIKLDELTRNINLKGYIMLDFFIVLILGMLSLFAVLEIYSRTVGRFFANRMMYKACVEMEELDSFHSEPTSLDPDINVVQMAEANNSLPITLITPKDRK